jgi:hypothetical protein
LEDKKAKAINLATVKPPASPSKGGSDRRQRHHKLGVVVDVAEVSVIDVVVICVMVVLTAAVWHHSPS